MVVSGTYNASVKRVYAQELLDNVAVCSQWPSICQEKDGILADDWFTGNPVLVINVADHQSLLGDIDTLPPVKGKGSVTQKNGATIVTKTNTHS